MMTAPANKENNMARAGCNKGFILQCQSHVIVLRRSYLDACISVDYIFLRGLLALAIMSSILKVY